MIKGLKVGLVLWMAIGIQIACVSNQKTRRDVPVVNGVVHVVDEGQTIEAIAKTYEVSSQLVVRRNNLREGDTLKPGTRLFIPGAEEIRAVRIEQADTTIREERDGLFHKVGPGETLLAIAKAYGLSSEEIQRVNNIRDPSRILINQELWIPRAKEVKDVEIPRVTVVTATPEKPIFNDPRVEEKAKPAPTPAKKTAVLSASPTTEVPSGASETAKTDPAPVEFPRKVKDFGPTKFQWPLKGSFKVLRVYNKSVGRDFNPGIDLGSNIGTDVCAAAEGEVLLVGGVNDTPLGTGFGNYIILYHGERNKKDLYSVYAHNSQNLVNAGEKVKRGQTIAKMGNSGRTVASEGGVLHFEIREDDEHLDPLIVLPPLE